MTTLADRPNTSLPIVDVQNGVVAHAHERDITLADIASLVSKAREAQLIWVQHSDEQLLEGTGAWQIVPELTPAKSEPIIAKHYGDAFEDTTLEELLFKLGVGKLFIAGAQTDVCIRSTIHGAFVRGYDVILVLDAHTTEDQSTWGAPPPAQVIAHTNFYWAYQTAPGRTAATVAAKDVNFSALRHQ